MFPGLEPSDLERVSTYPHAIVDIPTIWIPLSDGTRLAARVWYPEGADRSPVPAVLEYIPYRRRDGRLVDDEQIHPYLAGHGIAGVRVDMRGSGDSEGLLRDEYLEQEQDDAFDVIAWIAEQPWCNGSVGMMGLSWGGFAALQVAARQPPALKAIIAVGAAVDRYNDDVHYRNGCLLNENFGWASTFLAFASRPPDPAVVGSRWREMWLERLQHLPFLAEPWLEHQLRDDYWRHGSVCEDYEAITVPVMIVAGWSDLYVNAVPRLLENLHVPCHAIVGPWAHQYPHLATPGPTMDFLGAALDWWKRWLIDDARPTGAERTYLAYCQAGSSLDPFAPSRPGAWMSLDQWPCDHAREMVLHLTEDGLRKVESPAPWISVRSPVDTGTCAGELIPHCVGPELPQDQRFDDGASVVFDSVALAEPVDIWGDPVLTLSLSSDCPSGNLVVRLCDVAPDGTSQRVTYGVINLAHRFGDDRMVPMPVGRPHGLTMRLDHIAHRFPAGHRIRLALSTACWPMIWPTPENPTLIIHPAPARLTLPVIDLARGASQANPAMARAPLPPDIAMRRQPSHHRDIIRRLGERATVVEIEDDYGQLSFNDHGMINSGIKRERYTIGWDDPLTATAEIRWTQELSRDDWSVRTELATRLSGTRRAFHVTARLVAFENGHEVLVRDWNRAIPRRWGL